jgi:hypothetical protein
MWTNCEAEHWRLSLRAAPPAASSARRRACMGLQTQTDLARQSGPPHCSRGSKKEIEAEWQAICFWRLLLGIGYGGNHFLSS